MKKNARFTTEYVDPKNVWKGIPKESSYSELEWIVITLVSMALLSSLIFVAVKFNKGIKLWVSASIHYVGWHRQVKGVFAI